MKCCYRPRATRADLKSPCLSPVSFELEDIKAFVVVFVYSSEIQHPPHTHHLCKLFKKKKNHSAGRFEMLPAFNLRSISDRAIPAGVSALWRSLGAMLPAGVCQKPICKRPANVLEIKAPTCHVNSPHLYEAVKLFHLPLSRQIKGAPGEGCPRTKAKDGEPCLGA